MRTALRSLQRAQISPRPTGQPSLAPRAKLQTASCFAASLFTRCRVVTDRSEVGAAARYHLARGFAAGPEERSGMSGMIRTPGGEMTEEQVLKIFDQVGGALASGE